MNRIFLKGRLTANPSLKATATDVSVCEFSLAVPRRFNREQVDFINCQAWRSTAEFVNSYFIKGQEALVIGELHLDKWMKDGEPKFSTRVVVEEVYFCGSKAEQLAEASLQGKSESTYEEIFDEQEELPF